MPLRCYIQVVQRTCVLLGQTARGSQLFIWIYRESLCLQIHFYMFFLVSVYKAYRIKVYFVFLGHVSQIM